MIKTGVRSPLFYVGDKYKLMPQLSQLFPDNINTFYDPFVGGGSAFLNTKAQKYVLNDLDSNVIQLHKLLAKHHDLREELFAVLFNMVDDYDFTCSFKGKTVPLELKRKYIKTYYAVANKEAYLKLRQDFNESGCNDFMMLYMLLIYGFNHMIRFNSKGEFNLPVGNVDFNFTVHKSIVNYLGFVNENNIQYNSLDYIKFLEKQSIGNIDFVYFDPPYLISSSEYNKLWTHKDEQKLYDVLDYLNSNGIKFGISNLHLHKHRTNSILEKWMKKYNVHEIKSNYISFNDNAIKKGSREVFVTNYE